MPTVKSLDHVVLTVKDIDKTVAFYTEHLGMKHDIFKSPKDAAQGVERYVTPIYPSIYLSSPPLLPILHCYQHGLIRQH